ncbi:hypothetical protein DEO72_LG4g1108 [Vigna unguiculata]|uniref:Uncharacterized protein n=1 Tax=Vigna unguiculata TaxID=3917 RepID=A0A4D6LQ78_VIGUN|nr:hypothetical protein DEO72_LG4g1108 [Vigna unguiculata]
MKSVGASNSFLGLRGKLWLWGNSSASASKHDEEQRKICLEMQELESEKAMVQDKPEIEEQEDELVVVNDKYVI